MSGKVNVVGQQSRQEDQDLDYNDEANYLGNKEVSRTINMEIRVAIREMEVGAMVEMVIMKRKQIEIKKTSKKQMGIGMMALVYIYLQVIDTRRVVVLAGLKLRT